MACREIDAIHFVTNQMNAQEAAQFLDHVDHCPKCAEFFETVVRLRANRKLISDTLALKAVRNQETGFVFSQKSKWLLGNNWRMYALVSAAILIAVIGVLYYQHASSKKGYSYLATQEPYPFVPATFMGQEPTLAGVELFREGITLYHRKDYVAAADKFSAYARTNREDAEGQFFLGLCYYFQDKVHDAIRQINIALGLTAPLQSDAQKGKLREKYYWYLGNSYLKLDEKEKALQAFRPLVALNGTYASKAADLIRRLER